MFDNTFFEKLETSCIGTMLAAHIMPDVVPIGTNVTNEARKKVRGDIRLHQSSRRDRKISPCEFLHQHRWIIIGVPSIRSTARARGFCISRIFS